MKPKGFERKEYQSAALGEVKNVIANPTPKVEISQTTPVDEAKSLVEQQVAEVVSQLGITSGMDEYGMATACFNLPDSKRDVVLREPRAGDIQHMELEARRLEKQYGVSLDETMTSTYPLLVRLISKWGSAEAVRNPNNGLIQKPCVTYDDLDALSTNDVTALSAACNFFRSQDNS